MDGIRYLVLGLVAGGWTDFFHREWISHAEDNFSEWFSACLDLRSVQIVNTIAQVFHRPQHWPARRSEVFDKSVRSSLNLFDFYYCNAIVFDRHQFYWTSQQELLSAALRCACYLNTEQVEWFLNNAFRLVCRFLWRRIPECFPSKQLQSILSRYDIDSTRPGFKIVLRAFEDELSYLRETLLVSIDVWYEDLVTDGMKHVLNAIFYADNVELLHILLRRYSLPVCALSLAFSFRAWKCVETLVDIHPVGLDALRFSTSSASKHRCCHLNELPQLEATLRFGPLSEAQSIRLVFGLMEGGVSGAIKLLASRYPEVCEIEFVIVKEFCDISVSSCYALELKSSFEHFNRGKLSSAFDRLSLVAKLLLRPRRGGLRFSERDCGTDDCLADVLEVLFVNGVSSEPTGSTHLAKDVFDSIPRNFLWLAVYADRGPKTIAVLLQHGVDSTARNAAGENLYEFYKYHRLHWKSAHNKRHVLALLEGPCQE